ncbi:transporter substrate-binding domain-containing protein [Pseudoalteromonas sp. JBTF-M23]|uniref:Transporter substrate-binding domain-containing protein n=2 Tax=Pseudoalteromonas caenipelagi TaxID=2726988 RepID=A0A849VAY4_9GAMM|nr:transporter substrate-binding domain-containing protein [Pseudoalteromonas caenipelagi]NOU50145.1 transporter substrate-binding domain-containing protein [Pseudoalteromonas caenipelagi]
MLCSNISNAEEVSTKVIVAANAHLPPYVIPTNDSGIQLEILKAAFKQQGLSNIEVRYMSNLRAEQELLLGKVDVALNFPVHNHSKVYKSNSLVKYQNVAVSLSANNFSISSIYDLRGKSVLAFQHAIAYLQAPYKLVVGQLQSYEEVTNQEAQINNLMKGWVDVIILERRVFLYLLNKYAKNNELQPFKVHAIFSEAPRPSFFKDEKLRDTFNNGLDQIVKTGQYHTILQFDGIEYAKKLNKTTVK